MKRFVLLTLIVGITLTTSVSASDLNGEYMSMGDISCEQWAEGGQTDTSLLLAVSAWISGYITAYNLQTPGVYNIADSANMEGIIAMLEDYCDDNPENYLGDGMTAVTATLWPQRKTLGE